MEGAIDRRMVRMFGDFGGCFAMNEVATYAATDLTYQQVGCVRVDMQAHPASVVVIFCVQVGDRVVQEMGYGFGRSARCRCLFGRYCV